MTRVSIVLIALFGLLIVGLSSVYIVDERQKALVLQFGQIRDVKETPGLAFKLPFIQNVVYYDDRIQSLDTAEQEVTPLDDRRLVVDAFARWRISDVIEFRQAVGTGGIGSAEQRLDTILRAQLREVLGSVSSNAILSEDRIGLMSRIRDQAIVGARQLGIEVVDVRIKRTELPTQNLDETFLRMQAERAREAADERARGAEAAQRVRAQADRTAVELVSEAQRDSDIIRGEADAERNAIFADAFGRDPEFFAFYRSLSAYEQALGGSNSTMVITPDSEFFEYLKNDGSSGIPALPSGAAAPPEAPAEDDRAAAPPETAPDTEAAEAEETQDAPTEEAAAPGTAEPSSPTDDVAEGTEANDAPATGETTAN